MRLYLTIALVALAPFMAQAALLSDGWLCFGHILQKSEQDGKIKTGCKQEAPLACARRAQEKYVKAMQLYLTLANDYAQVFRAAKLGPSDKSNLLCNLLSSLGEEAHRKLLQNKALAKDTTELMHQRMARLSSIHARFPRLLLDHLAGLSESRLRKVDVILTAGYVLDIEKQLRQCANTQCNLANAIDQLYVSQRSIPADDLNGVNWKYNPDRDVDMRGGVFSDALDTAFQRTGVAPSQFEVTKWGKDSLGQKLALEYRVLAGEQQGAEVALKWPAPKDKGPAYPHIVYMTASRSKGGPVRGHVLLEDVPVSKDSLK